MKNPVVEKFGAWREKWTLLPRVRRACGMMQAKQLALSAVLGAVGVVLGSASFAQEWTMPDVGASGGSSFKLGEMAAFAMKSPPEPLPEITFQDGVGKRLSLASFKGKAIVLNVWATWCGPCRAEMPALNRLQVALGNRDVEVVALSIDRKGFAEAQKFLSSINAKAVTLVADDSAKSRLDLNISAMPTTILINKQGLEIGRFTGAAMWDSEEARKLVERALE